MDTNIIIPQNDKKFKKLAEELKKILPGRKSTKKQKLPKKQK
ncbi:MAG: hypothetical protein Q3983_05270 [Capnocytophaga sp.]|nr:hypothetical protein [Capnocytophaga sp.]